VRPAGPFGVRRAPVARPPVARRRSRARRFAELFQELAHQYWREVEEEEEEEDEDEEDEEEEDEEEDKEKKDDESCL
jgi:hypothetical protein